MESLEVKDFRCLWNWLGAYLYLKNFGQFLHFHSKIWPCCLSYLGFCLFEKALIQIKKTRLCGCFIRNGVGCLSCFLGQRSENFGEKKSLDGWSFLHLTVCCCLISWKTGFAHPLIWFFLFAWSEWLPLNVKFPISKQLFHQYLLSFTDLDY